MEDHLATIWNTHLKLYFNDYILPQQIIQLEHFALFTYARGVCYDISYLFNSSCYETFYGNFAHGIIHKIQYIEHIDKLCYTYIYILFRTRYSCALNLNHRNYYQERPIDMIVNYWSTNSTITSILKKLVNPNYCIVSKAQSYIRRWLAMRKIKKMKFQKVLEIIQLSPPFQIEKNMYKTFLGGSDYLALLDKNKTYSINIRTLRSGKQYIIK